jgi:hypothetical protein
MRYALDDSSGDDDRSSLNGGGTSKGGFAFSLGQPGIGSLSV